MSDTRSRQVSGFLPLLWILAVGLWALWLSNFAANWKSEFVALFAVHMALHLSLGWSNLFRARQRVLQVLYFAVQGVLVLSLSILGPTALGQMTLSIGLYLVLLGEAALMVRKIKGIMLLVGGYLLLYLLGLYLNAYATWGWEPYVFFIPLVISLLPFAVGYLQTQARARDRTMLQALETAHAQLTATHAELEMAHLRLAASAAQIEELTRLTERQRLARDLHDTLAQGLSGLILQLEVTNSRLVQGRNVQAQALVQGALLDARQVLGEARCAIDDLRAETFQDADFPERMEQAIRRFTTATSIPCTTELTCLSACPAPLQEHLLRITSEGLTNIERHAQARHAWITVREAIAGITLEVRDDGMGFDPDGMAKQGGHYGLVGVRERARLLGGDLELTSTPGAGTILRVLFPYTGKGDER